MLGLYYIEVKKEIDGYKAQCCLLFIESVPETILELYHENTTQRKTTMYVDTIY